MTDKEINDLAASEIERLAEEETDRLYHSDKSRGCSNCNYSFTLTEGEDLFIAGYRMAQQIYQSDAFENAITEALLVRLDEIE